MTITARPAGAAGPTSAALYARAQQVFPSGVTHDNRYAPAGSLYFDHATGSQKWDVDGGRYIDYWMGHGALLLGHSHPAIVAAVTAQMARGTHFGGGTALEVRWGELVQQMVPSAERVQFAASGTEAVMLALRLARAFTGRAKVLKFEGHFHGWSDPMTAGFHAPFNVPSSVGVPRATLDTVVVAPANDAARLDALLAADPDIACVILEPTGATYGTIPLAAGFLAAVREITRAHDTLLIMDEVVTGFRYGPGGIQGSTGVTPDLTTLAKILAGGLPGGAVAGRADVLSALEFRDDPVWNRYHRVHHPGTFNANPLSAAAGVAMLEHIADGQAQARAAATGEALTCALNDELRALGATRSCVYGEGSIFHVLLGQGGRVDARGRLEPDSLDTVTLRQGNPGPVKGAFHEAMRRRGVDLMSGQGGLVSSAHSAEDVAATAEAFHGAVRQTRDLLGLAV
jgi:glutamate-1-semialdehyde 2,1-aminomutase